MPDARAMTWEEAEAWEEDVRNGTYYAYNASGCPGSEDVKRVVVSAIALARQMRERAERAEETIRNWEVLTFCCPHCGKDMAAMRPVVALKARADALAEAVEGYITVNKRENVHSLFWRERTKFYEQMGERLAAYREGA